MSGIDHKNFALGRLYGRALLDAAASPADAEALDGELSELGKLLAREPDLAAYFGSPTVDAEAKRAAIEKIFRGQASDLLTDALQVIARKGRLDALAAVVAGYHEEYRASRGVLAATVETAHALSSEQRGSLSAALSRYTGKQVELSEQVNPNLLGGVVLRAGDERIDGSALAALAEAGSRLAARAAREIVSGKSYVES